MAGQFRVVPEVSNGRGEVLPNALCPFFMGLGRAVVDATYPFQIFDLAWMIGRHGLRRSAAGAVLPSDLHTIWMETPLLNVNESSASFEGFS